MEKLLFSGGSQTRPNIHIDDICDVYRFFLDNPDAPQGCYNAGFENISILNIAEMVKDAIGCDIEVTPSNDPRSYRQDSSKLLDLGFKPNKCVRDAIDDIQQAFNSCTLRTDDTCYTIRTMTKLGLG